MRRILFSLLMIVAAVAMIAGATKAYFNDTAEMTEVTFSTGSADLQMTQVNMQNWFAQNATANDLDVHFGTNLYPGYTGTWGHPDGVIYLGNFSTSPIGLVVTASLTNYNDTNNLGDVAQLAMAWGGNCDNMGTGTGFHTLNWWRSNPTVLFSYVSGSANSSECGFIPYNPTATPANPGSAAKSVAFLLKIPSSADNSIQGSTASFTIHFDAEQQY